ncbi:hypothetical protein [Spartinivicinus poritis]|uniref:Uncharacterized protein n=1 Tax=Spartinivicinus poritis TaxID=2994640 RepID=A0ABT5UB77_9GAMM|nr:hypothetical protein [Spartinivicinus sp. A2-2]MDE1463628.1 hypothetical protein [Spartinivicinus sp. A2-2]
MNKLKTISLPALVFGFFATGSFAEGQKRTDTCDTYEKVTKNFLIQEKQAKWSGCLNDKPLLKVNYTADALFFDISSDFSNEINFNQYRPRFDILCTDGSSHNAPLIQNSESKYILAVEHFFAKKTYNNGITDIACEVATHDYVADVPSFVFTYKSQPLIINSIPKNCDEVQAPWICGDPWPNATEAKPLPSLSIHAGYLPSLKSSSSPFVLMCKNSAIQNSPRFLILKNDNGYISLESLNERLDAGYSCLGGSSNDFYRINIL